MYFWERGCAEAENIRVNTGMVRAALEAVSLAKTVQHVAFGCRSEALSWAV
jgi:hypothetical protein